VKEPSGRTIEWGTLKPEVSRGPLDRSERRFISCLKTKAKLLFFLLLSVKTKLKVE
jgi:hypothetical protein